MITNAHSSLVLFLEFCFVLFVCGVVVFLHNYVLAASVQYFIFHFYDFLLLPFAFL